MSGQALGNQEPDGWIQGHAAMAAADLDILAAVMTVVLQGGLPVDDTITLGIDRGGGHRWRLVDHVLVDWKVFSGIQGSEQSGRHRGRHSTTPKRTAQGDHLHRLRAERADLGTTNGTDVLADYHASCLPLFTALQLQILVLRAAAVIPVHQVLFPA